MYVHVAQLFCVYFVHKKVERQKLKSRSSFSSNFSYLNHWHWRKGSFFEKLTPGVDPISKNYQI
jgi:hypothetical protein